MFLDVSFASVVTILIGLIAMVGGLYIAALQEIMLYVGGRSYTMIGVPAIVLGAVNGFIGFIAVLGTLGLIGQPEPGLFWVVLSNVGFYGIFLGNFLALIGYAVWDRQYIRRNQYDEAAFKALWMELERVDPEDGTRGGLFRRGDPTIHAEFGRGMVIESVVDGPRETVTVLFERDRVPRSLPSSYLVRDRQSKAKKREQPDQRATKIISFSSGDRVSHPIYGHGEVITIRDGMIEVQFSDSSITVSSARLRRE
ncbi:MAG: hypothetical protein GYB68_16595 [Chloroflexi bacterium]|nr:hypothetical protein [Chloroflexota bacterium]